jgi:hypothetical protein
MGNRTIRAPGQGTPDDVGTLWTMQRGDRTCRCALLAWPTRWELCVLVDDKTLLSERCTRVDAAFGLADRWKIRLLEQGWRQIVPRPAGRAQIVDRQSM